MGAPADDSRGPKGAEAWAKKAKQAAEDGHSPGGRSLFLKWDILSRARGAFIGGAAPLAGTGALT
jgi:hypothetical protein